MPLSPYQRRQIKRGRQRNARCRPQANVRSGPVEMEWVSSDGMVWGEILVLDGSVDIYHWQSDLEGRGLTVKAIKELKREFPGREIVVHGIGVTDEDASWRYWVHMKRKGLVDVLLDDGGGEIQPNARCRRRGRHKRAREVSVEEALEMIYENEIQSYRDLYPGFSDSPNEYSDEYYFQSRGEAIDFIEDMYGYFECLPEPIPVYRAIRARSKRAIRLEYPGRHWSAEKSSALTHGRSVGANFLLEGLVNSKDVYWYDTVYLWIANYGWNEYEISIPSGEAVYDLQIKLVKRGKVID